MASLEDSDWAGLPPEILAIVFELAASPAGAAADATALPLAEAARLRLALEGTCRAWRAVAADLPLRVSLGCSPLPPSGVLPRLVPFLTRRPLAALHFAAAPGGPGSRPGVVQQLAIDLLATDALAAAAAGSLAELAVREYTCSRPLCGLLPRFPRLTRLSLCGYAIDLGE